MKVDIAVSASQITFNYNRHSIRGKSLHSEWATRLVGDLWGFEDIRSRSQEYWDPYHGTPTPWWGSWK